jgi:uncharacterized iron-regulated membrane protein
MKPLLFFKISAYLMLLTAFFHTLSFFSEPKPANDTEKNLFELMKNYQRDLGLGFTPTTNDLMTGLSACFSLLCLFGGLTNLLLLKKNQDASLLKGILNIELLVFGLLFVLMTIYTFLPPIVLTGLIFLCLIGARISTNKP